MIYKLSYKFAHICICVHKTVHTSQWSCLLPVIYLVWKMLGVVQLIPTCGCVTYCFTLRICRWVVTKCLVLEMTKNIMWSSHDTKNQTFPLTLCELWYSWTESLQKKESFQFVQVFSVPQITMSSCSRAKPLIQAETGDRLKGKLWKEISFILPHLIYGHRSGYRTQYVIFLWRVSISSPTQSTFGILSRCFLDASRGGKAWGGQRCVSHSNCWRCGNEGLAATQRKKLNMQEVRPIPHLKLRLLHPTPIFIISLFSFYFHSLLSFPKRSFIIWGNW